MVNIKAILNSNKNLAASYSSLKRKYEIQEEEEEEEEKKPSLTKKQKNKPFTNLKKQVEEKLLTLYGLEKEETHHITKGHNCVTIKDQEQAKISHSNLLYGEILFEGVCKLFDKDHLNVEKATSLIDLGSGMGKLIVQSFLQYPNLKEIIGVELASGRYQSSVDALKKLHKMETDHFTIIQEEEEENRKEEKEERKSMSSFQIIENTTGRKVELFQGSLFNLESYISKMDIIICETKLMNTSYSNLCKLLEKAHPTARLLTYENLDTLYRTIGRSNPFRRLKINKYPEDRFLTSWNNTKGHHFYLWEWNTV